MIKDEFSGHHPEVAAQEREARDMVVERWLVQRCPACGFNGLTEDGGDEKVGGLIYWKFQCAVCYRRVLVTPNPAGDDG